MKKLNKKGFTIVELVIVIAVIAILAAVLIPTFATVIDKANKSAAYQASRNALTEYVAENAEKLDATKDYEFFTKSYKVIATDNEIVTTSAVANTGKVTIGSAEAAGPLTADKDLLLKTNGNYILVHLTSGTTITADTYFNYNEECEETSGYTFAGIFNGVAVFVH